MKSHGWFIDVDGRIHQLADWYEGGCSANYRVYVECDTVYEIVAEEEKGCYLLGNEYTLWPTLTELARVIEGDV